MFGLPQRIIVFDIEYTTWEGAQERNWSGPNEFKEIVQIGAVAVETDNFSELGWKIFYVCPVKNPILSDYFTALTGITQEKVDKEAVTLKEALHQFKDWVGDNKLYCWGGDMKVLKDNAELIKIDFPFDLTDFSDIREIFKSRGIPTDKFMSSTIPRAFGLEPPSHAHDGLNDARSIVMALRALKSHKVSLK